MPYRILSTPEFDEDFSKLSPDSVQRIRDKLRQLAENPQLLRFPLKGLPSSLKGLHKYRVGNYRVLLWPDHNKEEIVLYAVAHRREIYRRLGGN
jgi:mRNA interferase RelE/StbE